MKSHLLWLMHGGKRKFRWDWEAQTPKGGAYVKPQKNPPEISS